MFDIQPIWENLVDGLRFTLSKLVQKEYNNHGDISNSIGLLTFNVSRYTLDLYWSLILTENRKCKKTMALCSDSI